MFTFQNMYANYGTLEALKNITLQFAEGEITAILGHNGAGKTTLLKSAVGEHPEITGIVKYQDVDIVPGAVHRNVKLGIGFVPQEENVFGDLEVEQNLKTAGVRFGDSNLGMVYELFPRLAERSKQMARSLSGGERQMLAVGMALMTNPQVLFLDEPTTGLAPYLVRNVLSALRHVNEKMSICTVIVEQNVQAVLEVVNRVVVLKLGEVAFDGATHEVQAKEDLWELF